MAVFETIGVDISKIECDGQIDTVLWRKLLDLYNEKTGDEQRSLV